MSTRPSEGRDENGQVAWSRRRPGLAAMLYLFGYVAVAALSGWLVHVLGTVLAPYLREPASTAAVLGLGLVVTVSVAVVLALSLLLILSVCRTQMGARGEIVAVLCLSALFSLARPSMFTFLGKALGIPEAGARLAQTLSVLPGQLLIGNTVLIVWATFLGKLVSRIIREGNLIVPVAVVAAVADVVTVFWGVVRHVTEAAPEVAEAFSAAAPVELPKGVYAPILTFVGIGDFLFLALFLAVAIRYSMQPVKTLWASFAVMLVAPLAFAFVPAETGMPGLPFLAAAALWANWRHIRFSPQEKRALALAALLVAGAVGGLWMAFHR